MQPLLVVGGGALLATVGTAKAGATLDAIKKKGFVQCGVSTGLAGFSNPDDAGNWSGLDVDVCRGVAAALFGDADAVKYTPLTSKERFTALQSGEVDVLSRNTTWTLSRDSALGLDFVGVTYYDGQGFMVPQGARRQERARARRRVGLRRRPARPPSSTSPTISAPTTCRSRRSVFERPDEARTAYEQGRCDVYTTDKSGLYAERTGLAKPGRPHRAAGDDLEGAARPGRPPRRQRVGRRRALDAVRDGPGRGARRQLGQRRRP